MLGWGQTGITRNHPKSAAWSCLGSSGNGTGSSSGRVPEDSWELGLGFAWELQELEPGMSQEPQEIKLGISAVQLGTLNHAKSQLSHPIFPHLKSHSRWF